MDAMDHHCSITLLIVYGGCISDGNRHDHHNLLHWLAGRGGRGIQTGRLLEFSEYTR